MSDLIDRQTAISAICNACGKIDCDKMDKCEKLQLPPANNSEIPNSSDTISRAKAIDICRAPHMRNADCSDFEMAIMMLPSAQPEQRWIPVTERLTKNREWVLGIFQEGDTGWINPIPFICDYVGKKTPITTQDNWLLKMVDEPHPYYKELHCIAWMPLPEPWKEGEAE